MTNGIYLYYDTEKNSVVYVGRDSYIDKNKRHKAHMIESRYDEQSVNRVLQNNPDRYKYVVFCEGIFSNEELNDLEIQAIKLFNTHQREDAFNFTEGGDGIVGFKHSEENKRKIGEAQKGKKIPEETRKKMSEARKGKYSREKNPMYGRKQSEETRKKISEALKGKKIPEETRKKISEALKGIKRSEETKKKISEAHKKDYARVTKAGFQNGKQRYVLKQNGETITKSIYKEKLEKLAEERNKKQDDI